MQLVGRLPHQLSGLSHQLCVLPHQLLSGLIVFWLPNEHFPRQAHKAIGFEDSLALEFFFAKFSKDNHQLTWHFAPPAFSEKLRPCVLRASATASSVGSLFAVVVRGMR